MFEMRVMQKGIEEKSHSHQDYELFLVLSGDAYVSNGQETTHVRRDDMFFINSNVKHKCRIVEDSIVLSFQISYSDAYKIIALPYIQYDVTPRPGKIEHLAELRRLLKKIVTLSVRGTTLDNIRLNSLYNEVMLVLVSHFSNWSPSQMDNNAISRTNRFQMIQDYIINNYNRQLSLQHLSDQFGLSIPYLSKYLKRELGMGFVQYVNNIRLHMAVDDLLQTSRPVTQIAYDNGFTNLTSFNRLFKAAFNSSPSEYRKNNQRHEDNKETVEKHTSQVLGKFLSENPFTLLEDDKIPSVRASIAVAEDASPLGKNWNQVVAFGAANNLLDSEIQKHLLSLCKGLGIRNLRLWGLFNEENVIDKNAQVKFNFKKLNQIFDFLHDNGLVPYVDLGFQADELYSGLEETIRYVESDIEFTELGQYNKLLTQFLKNAVNRYGMEYVCQWKFDFWKDPRLPFENEDVTYFRVFDVAYESIRNILPEAKIGGCGLAVLGSTALFEKTLKIWSKRETKPDFFTVALYPYHYSSENRLELSQDGDYFMRSIQRLQSLLRDYGLDDRPLYINEWNVTRSNRNSINDSCYKAAFIVKNTIQCIGHVDGMTYKGTTDLLSEHFDTTGVLLGGQGLLTTDGIRKPAYYAYQFLNRLGSRLLSAGENYIATKDHDDIIVLCHNCIQPNLDYYYHYKDNIKPEELGSLFEDKKLNLLFALTQVKGRSYVAKKYRLNEQAGSLLNIWLEAGMPESADKEDIQYYQSMCIPNLSSGTVEVVHSRINYKTLLEPNEIQLIHFRQYS